MAHFATSKAYKKAIVSLVNIRQGKDESLKSYLMRFNQATLEIKDLSSTVTMHLILVGFKLRDFSKSLAKRLVESMTELLAQSTKFINMEEVVSAKWQANWLLE